jgi:hypothetical protein
VDVNASRRLLASLPVLAVVLLLLSGPVASLRSSPSAASPRRPPLAGLAGSALPRRGELHLERGTGAYERQYWYEYDRSTWDGMGLGHAGRDRFPQRPIRPAHPLPPDRARRRRHRLGLRRSVPGVFDRYQPGPVQWDPIAEGLPNCPVYDVQLANDGKQLIAFTHGRGAWCIDTDTIVKPTYYLACEPGIPLEAGVTIDGYAVFTRPPKRGTTARVVSSDPRVLSVPRLAYFRPGKVSATFPLRARPVANPTWVTVTATVDGVARSFRVLVLPRRQGGRAP